MNKYIKLTLAAAAGLLFTTVPVLAASSLLSGGSGGSKVFTVVVTTPHKKEVAVDEISVFAGRSCANIKLLKREVASPPDDTLSVLNDTNKLSSSALADKIGMGRGCFKFTIMKNGRTYSTGLIRVRWTGTKYRGAWPASVTLNIK